jgi:hypothetical protein
LQKTSAIINRILGAGRIGYFRCIHSWIPFRSIGSVFAAKLSHR